jgi:hypothetical protein
MPDMSRIERIGARFASVTVQYFGGFTWLLAPLSRVLGADRAAALSDTLDHTFRVRRLAFKFVLVARGRL